MIEFLFALGALFAFGSSTPLAKKAIETIGRYRAISYFYIILSILLVGSALLLNIDLSLPEDLIYPYIAQIIIGALGIIAFYKGLELGKSSILSPIGRVHILIVIALSILFLGEILSFAQIMGSLLVLASALLISFGRNEENKELKLEKGIPFVLIAILCWGYYYTFLKLFIIPLGAYKATVLVEFGVACLVVLYYLLTKKNLSFPGLKNFRFTFIQGIILFAAVLLYGYSVESIGAALTASILAGVSIVNAIISYFLLKEKLDYTKYGAILLLVLGLGLIALFG